jgi:RsiW-degrading membrane proteinase PrsW (M82 family)
MELLESFSHISGAFIITSVIVGALPALLWLLFWLREDSEHPEPRTLLVLAFIAGMLAVPLVIPIQGWLEGLLGGSMDDNVIPVVVAWALAEEFIKIALCGLFVLWRHDVDEPIDFVVYLLTTALGFAALENALYLLVPIVESNIGEIAITSQSRFLGANLLHAVASAIVGVGIAVAVGHTKLFRITTISIAIVASVGLHAFFNLLLIFNINGTGLLAFLIIWIIGTLLLFSLEKIKHMKPMKKSIHVYRE